MVLPKVRVSNYSLLILRWGVEEGRRFLLNTWLSWFSARSSQNEIRLSGGSIQGMFRWQGRSNNQQRTYR